MQNPVAAKLCSLRASPPAKELLILSKRLLKNLQCQNCSLLTRKRDAVCFAGFFPKEMGPDSAVLEHELNCLEGLQTTAVNPDVLRRFAEPAPRCKMDQTLPWD